MGGKASLFLLLGFSTILMTLGINMNRVSSSAVDNSTSYYEEEMAKNVARSGVNLALSQLSVATRNKTIWTPSTSMYSYMGTNNLKITMSGSGLNKTIKAIGEYESKDGVTITKEIEVKVKEPSFSEFAYFSNIEGNIWWTGDDNVSGPFHTNDNLQVQGHPTFDGPTTSHAGNLVYYKNEATDAPTIFGEYTTGLTIDIPLDGIAELAAAASTTGGYTFSGESKVYIEFDEDSISYKFNSSDPYTKVLGTDLSSDGIIYVADGDLYVSGVVDGQWSIGSKDDIIIEDDLTYLDVPDPLDMYDTSDDLLGLLAKDDVIIRNNTNNNANDINIHAAIYCESGGFTAEKYDKRGVEGDINLIGGITQYKRGPVGNFSVNWWTGTKTLKNGFDKNYQYDNRLQRMVLPYFPLTNTYRVISWLE